VAGLVLCVEATAASQPADLLQAWNQRVEPVRIAGNVYYVGMSGVSSFLITTPAGHILLESGFAQSVPYIRAGVEKLGFRFADIKILLAGHAHPDHVAGHAAIHELTGAKVMVMEEDATRVEQGIAGVPLAERDGLEWPPVPVDRRLHDGDTVTLGDTTLKAWRTPGHTAGCTTWTMTVVENGQPLQVVFAGSFTILEGTKLTGDPRYPDRAQAYLRAFDVLRSLKVDVFLAEHPEMFAFAEKVQHMGPGRNPFVDPKGYRRAVDAGYGSYSRWLEAERRSHGR
jgi:metallo-beta-lactamase class B